MTTSSNTRAPLILHVDMDSFFVSVERLRDPSLIGKPVVVGGTPDGRGVVASASYEARRHGVRSAMPAGEARRLCPNAIFVRPTAGEYGRYSAMIREVLESFTPLVEMASQDEAYLDMAGTERRLGNPPAMANAIRAAIMQRTSLPCSIGAGANRLVAKIASDQCKPNGMLWIPGGSEREFLARLPLSRVPGIGPKTIERLRALGLRHGSDVQRVDPQVLARALGQRTAAELIAKANGIGGTMVTPHEDPKSISHETTFDTNIGDQDELSGILLELAEKVAARLRAHEWRATTITLKYRYADFETHTASRTLSAATADERVLHREAIDLLRSKRDGSRPLRLIGIGTSGFEHRDAGQVDLLGAEEGAEKRERLLGAMDKLREKHGFDSIRAARSAKRQSRD